MAEMKKAELVLIPAASVAHLVPCVEFANLLITQNNNLSITILIMHLPFGTSILSFKNSLAESLDPRIKFIDLKPEVTTDPSSQKSPPTIHMFSQFLNSRKPLVKEILAELSKSENCKLAGVVFDVLYTSMFDVAIEFEVPYYVFSPFGASMIALMSHLQSLRDDHNVDVNDLKVSEIDVPAYINPVPTRVLPSMLLYKEGGRNVFLDVAKRYRAAKGIIINSFNELETQAIEALSKDANLPPVYAVGPLLNHKGGKWNDNQKQQQQQEGVQSIKKWLDAQPNSSVVFFCFGSAGAFDDNQVKEMANGIERSGYRFLWSLRKPPPPGNFESPTDYENLDGVLPEGFAHRNSDVGKVVGWVPQAAILSHPAIGGFVSHCGWNSVLESVWYGVPIATWPLYAENQVTAFLLVKDLELAVEIKMDYVMRAPATPDLGSEDVSAELIEKGIRLVMDPESEVRKKVKQMQAKSQSVLEEGGSSFTSVRCFIDEVISLVL